MDHDKSMISYYGEVEVGDNKQLFSVLIDSGSSEIFLPSKNCTSDSCKKHHKYYKTKTYRYIGNEGSIEVLYLIN